MIIGQIVIKDNEVFIQIFGPVVKTQISTETPNAKQFIQSLLYQIVTGFKMPQVFMPQTPVYDNSGNMMYIQTSATSDVAPTAQ